MNDNPTYESIKQYIGEALQGFVNDPADSEFQEGYQAALFVIAVEALGLDYPEEPLPEIKKKIDRSYLRVVK